VRIRERNRLKTAADVALPFLVALFLAGLVDDSPGIGDTERIVGILAALVQGAALWWRRSHPQIVTAIALAGGLVIALVAPDGLIPFAGLVAVFTLAANRVPRISLFGLVGLVALSALNFGTATDEEATFVMVFPFVAWVLGEASRRAVSEASRRAVADERARIARELHDVIAHSVSVIVIQAAAADDVFDEHPDQAREALRSIEGAGREALAELRRLLAAVRLGEGDGDPLRPLPGLDRLDELADTMRTAGLEVTIDRDGLAAARLPAGVDLSAYRIVQEALTNTLRHAAATRADVTVRATDGVLELVIHDDGHGAGAGSFAAGSGAGRGIAGMRERAAMLGGTLETGPPAGGGGFRVHARLPLGEPR